MGEYSVITFLVIFALTSAAPPKIPASWGKCSRNDPNFNECLKNVLKDVIPVIFTDKGEPSIGLLPLDPIFIPAIGIGENEKSSVNIKLDFANVSLSGMGSLRMENVQSDFNDFKLALTAYATQPLYFTGKYEMNGKVLILPIRGKGDCNLRLDNVNATITIYGKEKTKKDQTYMEITSADLKYTTKKLTLNFDGLFSNDGQKATGQAAAVGEAMNKFLNENWEEIHNEVQPAFEQALAAVFKDTTGRVFNRIPFKDIIP